MMVGILGLAHGDHPRLIEEKLRAFLMEDFPPNAAPGVTVRNLPPRTAKKAKPHAISARSSQ